MLAPRPGCCCFCCLPGEDTNLAVSELDQLEERSSSTMQSKARLSVDPDLQHLELLLGAEDFSPPHTPTAFLPLWCVCVCVSHHHVFIQKCILRSFLNCDVSFFHVSFLNVFSAWRTVVRHQVLSCPLTVDGVCDRLSVKGNTDTLLESADLLSSQWKYRNFHLCD